MADSQKIAAALKFYESIKSLDPFGQQNSGENRPMPISNALIQATPRNALLGGLSDFLAQSYSPERTQHMQGIAKFLSAPEISRTLDRLSYGEPLTTGAGGLGGTTKFNNDALDAMMAVAPMVGPGAKVVGQGAMMAGRAGEKLAERVVPQVMQRGGLPAEMLGAMGNRTVSPLDVYHGSPHTLPPTPRNPLGEFDASKIGTGEGAQAYGHGIYVAEARPVAEGYANRLGSNVITVEGKPMDFNNPVHIAASIISDPNNAGLPGKQLASAIRYDPKRIVPFGAESKAEEIAKALENGNLPKFTNQKGNLYKVDLPDEKIAKMLDWDKPLNEQPDVVKNITPESLGLKYTQLPNGNHAFVNESGKILGNLQKGGTEESFTKNWMSNLMRGTGSDLYKQLSQGMFTGPRGAESLRQAGIPGIKYLDEISRNTNQGTRNFVVFPGEEKSMTILERNGQKFYKNEGG